MRTLYTYSFDTLTPPIELKELGVSEKLRIRFLPLWEGANVPGLLRSLHFNETTDKLIRCRRNLDGVCGVCNHPDWQTYHYMQAAYCVNGTDTFSFSGFSSRVYFTLLEKCVFPEYNNIVDPNKGHDIFINTVTGSITIDPNPSSADTAMVENVFRYFGDRLRFPAHRHRRVAQSLAQPAITH